MEKVAQWHPDVVLLDLSLPDMDGQEVCRELRAWTQVPIIVLSVRGGDVDKVTALESGADDYLTKPFSMGELLARVRVALRHAAQAGGADEHARSSTPTGSRWTSSGARVSVQWRGGASDADGVRGAQVSRDELGKVVTHRVLLHAVWGPAYDAESHYLRVFINQLRRKIEPDPSRPRYLLTEPGIGYRLRSAD